MLPTVAAATFAALGVALAVAEPQEASVRGRQAPAPAPWERSVQGAFENRGVAHIERLGTRWILNVLCDGTHATYIDDTTLNLTRYTKGYVRARYQYVDRQVHDPKCIAAPCAAITERRIALQRVSPISVTEKKASDLARACSAPAK